MKYVVKVNGRVLTEEESREHTEAKVELHGGIPEIVKARKSAALETDTSFMAMHNTRSKLETTAAWNKRREQVALSAKQHGMNDSVMYDPTLASATYSADGMCDGRSEWKKRQEMKKSRLPAIAPPNGKKRLHPRVVRDIKQKMIAENPDVARRDQRELTEEIVERHGST